MRNIVTTSLAAALLAALAAPASALAAPTAVSADAHMAAALDLARLVNESSQMEAQLDQVLASIATQSFSTDPSLIAIKEEYPGVEKVFLDTMRPILMSELTRLMPEYNQAVADFFAGHFTLAEIGELMRFWRSDAGRALLRSVSNNFEYGAITKEVVGQVASDEALNISGEAIDADKKTAAVKGVRALNAEQRVAVMRFGLTPTGRKMAKLVDKKNEIDRQWVNRDLSPEAEARIEREMSAALLAHIEEQDRVRASDR